MRKSSSECGQFACTGFDALKQTHVLDRYRCLVGERRSQFDLFIGEGPHRIARQHDDAYRSSFAHQRNAEHGSESAKLLSLRQGIFRIARNIPNLDRSTLSHRAPKHCPAPRHNRAVSHIIVVFMRKAKACNVRICVSFWAMDSSAVRLAEACCGLDEGIEHRLQIESRAADDLQHVGGGRLLSEGFSQFLCARLHFVEQAYILDRNHRLVGKCRDQLDLLISEWLHGSSDKTYHSNWSPLSQQRNAEHGPEMSQLYALS